MKPNSVILVTDEEICGGAKKQAEEQEEQHKEQSKLKQIQLSNLRSCACGLFA